MATLARSSWKSCKWAAAVRGRVASSWGLVWARQPVLEELQEAEAGTAAAPVGVLETSGVD